MDRKELAKTLHIFKNDKSNQKGFSLRRTIKVLHDYKQNEPVIEFWKQLIERDESKW